MWPHLYWTTAMCETHICLQDSRRRARNQNTGDRIRDRNIVREGQAEADEDELPSESESSGDDQDEHIAGPLHWAKEVSSGPVGATAGFFWIF